MTESLVYSMKREMLRRGLSQRTVSSYCFCIKKFLKNYNKDYKKITKIEIKGYLDDLAEMGRSGSTINLYFCSIKFFLEEVMHRNINLNLKFSRRPKKFPTVLTQEETKRLFSAIKNEKHLLMIKLLYSAGLRVSELINLRVKDLELNKNYGWVREGKGRKDRVFIIAEDIKENLQKFILENKIDYDSFLFKGVKNRNISRRTIAEIIKTAAKRAKILKNVHCHTLRHSFATHLVENGYSVNDIQGLLGHNRADTTMMYIHMANPKLFNIKSPLDDL